MAGPSSLKPPTPPHLSSMKLKTLFQTFVFSHIYPIARAFTKAKSLVIKLLEDIHLVHLVEFPPLMKKNKKNNKLFFGSFRLHYNWCSSSHVMPLGQESHVYYDSSWNTHVVPTSFDYRAKREESDELSRYLEWLEEEKGNVNMNQESRSCNEIDRLADMFIADCHEKFRLEKQESYRRFQEMMARSV